MNFDINVTVAQSGDVRRSLTALRRVAPDAKSELKEASNRIAKVVAARAELNQRRAGRQASLIPIRVGKGLNPFVAAGGMKRVGRNKKPAYAIMFGSEFGSHGLKQFRPWIRGSYWFMKSSQDSDAGIARELDKAAEAVLRNFGRN